MANVSMVGYCGTTIEITVVTTTASILLVEMVVALAVWTWRKRHGRLQTDEEYDKINRLNIDHNVKICELENTISEKDADVRDRNRTIEQQDHDIQTLRASLKDETEARQHAMMRLSEVAAARLTDNNPAIVDLSDSFRPTKLGDMMSELYDNHWTSAFFALQTRHGPRPEEGRDYMNTLLAILRKERT